jgi:putative ABC transport system permease protein
MWGVTFADLRFRYRQFLIAVIGAGVVLAMAMLLSGLVGGFGAEIDRTVQGVGAQWWVLSDNAHGRITGGSLFPVAEAQAISQAPGVTRAAPLAVLAGQVARINGASKTVYVFGVQLGDMGDPTVTAGRALSANGQVVSDVVAGAGVGSRILVGSKSFVVVGEVANRTMQGGLPVLYLTLHDAQELALGGRPLATAVVTRGKPSAVPAGLAVLSNQGVQQSTLEQMAGAISSINNSKIIMWVVAAIIVAALLYVSALQRVRDFAVLKALGSSSFALYGSLAVQSVVVTLLAAGLAMILVNFMGGVFKQPVVIPAAAYASLPAIAVGIGLISSLVGARRAMSADPAAAFGG